MDKEDDIVTIQSVFDGVTKQIKDYLFSWNGSVYTAQLLSSMVNELFKVKTWFSMSSYYSRVFWL